jgi:hypothetical protein
MPAVKDVGEPCAGEPHARFDGRALETEQRPRAADKVCRESHGMANPANLPVTHCHRASARPYVRPAQLEVMCS